jgi:hypothetical protein
MNDDLILNTKFISSILITVIGVVFCVVRIMFCVCPSHCISRRDRNKKNAKVDADHRTSLLGDTKRVSIARGPYINVRFTMRNSLTLILKHKSFIKKNIAADDSRCGNDK